MGISSMIGQNALISIVSHIFFIGISFYALQAIMFEKVFKKNHVFQIQLLFILLSIAIGSTVSNFFLTFTGWSSQLPYLFE